MNTSYPLYLSSRHIGKILGVSWRSALLYLRLLRQIYQIPENQKISALQFSQYAHISLETIYQKLR